MWNNLEQKGLTVLEHLESAGYEAYFVGGYVRDKVWGRPVKDIDIATSALPEEVVRLFHKTIPTGLKHGTVTVMIEGTAFEVTTFRRESDYADYRRPAEVEFISRLEEDLQRRDFTMNAMAMDSRGVIRDPYGGQEDMKKKLLRCVGDPLERFREDALRMMRCVRFASTYGLTVDLPTWEALLARRELLRHVAMERVRVELERLVAGPGPYQGWKLLLDSSLLDYTKVGLDWKYRTMGARSLSAALSALGRLEQPLHRWMLIMLESGLNAEETKELLRSLTFSVKDLERIAKTIAVDAWVRGGTELPEAEACPEPAELEPSDLWKLAAVSFGLDAMKDWLAVKGAAAAADGSSDSRERAFLSSGALWLKELPVRELKELAVSGQDLIRASGKAAGPWVGRTMAKLLRLAALGRVPNAKDALLARALSEDAEGESKPK